MICTGNKYMRRWLVFGSLLLGLFLVGCGASETPTSFPGSTTTEAEQISTISGPRVATSIPTYDVQALRATEVTLMRILPTATPDQALDPSKQADWQLRDLRVRAASTARALYPPPRTVPPEWIPTRVPHTPWPSPTPQQLAGAGEILTMQYEGPLSRVMYVSNIWHEQQAGYGFTVYCGVQKADAAQGVLVVEALDGDGLPIQDRPDTYLIPSHGGAVRVVDAVGERLTLQNDAGGLFYFDVPARQWVIP